MQSNEGSAPNQSQIYDVGSPKVAVIIAVPSQSPKQEGLVVTASAGSTTGDSLTVKFCVTVIGAQPLAVYSYEITFTPILLADGVKVFPETSVPLNTPPEGDAVRLRLPSSEHEFGVDVMKMLEALRTTISSEAVSPPHEFPSGIIYK